MESITFLLYNSSVEGSFCLASQDNGTPGAKCCLTPALPPTSAVSQAASVLCASVSSSYRGDDNGHTCRVGLLQGLNEEIRAKAFGTLPDMWSLSLFESQRLTSAGRSPGSSLKHAPPASRDSDCVLFTFSSQLVPVQYLMPYCLVSCLSANLSPVPVRSLTFS